MSLRAADVREGLEGPPLRVENVDRAMFVRYAGASGDFNPIHWNEDFARGAGYPSVFGMGMFSAGVLSSFLTAWMGAGTVHRYRVRFTGQVWPGETLICTGRVTAVEPAGDGVRATCELAVHNENGERKIAAEAVCNLPG